MGSKHDTRVKLKKYFKALHNALEKSYEHRTQAIFDNMKELSDRTASLENSRARGTGIIVGVSIISVLAAIVTTALAILTWWRLK